MMRDFSQTAEVRVLKTDKWTKMLYQSYVIVIHAMVHRISFYDKKQAKTECKKREKIKVEDEGKESQKKELEESQVKLWWKEQLPFQIQNLTMKGLRSMVQSGP